MSLLEGLRPTSAPTWTVHRFRGDVHLPGAVALARRVNEHDSAYPPPGTGETEAALTAWLSQDTVARWVATTSSGTVVGHVAVTEPHPYLIRHLATIVEDPASSILEVGQLFADPADRGTGLGAALLATACRTIWDRHKTVGLAVMDTTPAAIRLYRRSGLRDAGTFDGIHGLNYVFTSDE